MMGTKTNAALAIVLLLTASVTGSLVRAPLAQATEAPTTEANEQGAARMVVLKDQDVSGEVFKRFGLPDQNYCWEKCLQEARCAATRWGVIEGSTAGQCQLLSGELTLGQIREIKTSDGLRILVTASKKEKRALEESI